MWLILALIGYVISAAVGILDKFILDKKSVSAAAFAFYSSIFVLPIFLLLPFGVKMPQGGGDWAIMALSGVAFGLGLWTMYKGVETSEISHLGPFMGAVIPIFVFTLSHIFLGEVLSNQQMLAGGLLVLGSFVISFEQSREHNGWHAGFAWGLLASVFFAVSHVSAKYAYSAYGFYSGFVWTRGFLALLGLALLLSPILRQEIFRPRASKEKKPAARLALVATNKILGVVAVILVQYAVALGSVSLVNALNGVQFGLLVLMVALLSKFYPKFFKEDYARAEIYQEILAVVLIGLGLYFLI